MAPLRDIMKEQIDAAMADLHRDIGNLPGQHAPNPLPFRAPPQHDVYDENVAFVSPVARFSPGVLRQSWSHPEVALTHTPVSSLLSSGQAGNTQTAQIIGGVKQDVVAPTSAWGAVPNMQLVVRANGPVHVTASLSVKSTDASDVVSFAFYRNGSLVSQIFTHTTPSAAGKSSLVNLSMIDTNVDAHGFLNPEIYALYWKAGTGTLTAVGSQRSMYAINLTPL